MPASIHVGSRNAQLVNSDLVSSTADLELTVDGPLARAPKVSGAVIFKTLEVNVPDRLPASLKPCPTPSISTRRASRGRCWRCNASKRPRSAGPRPSTWRSM